MALGDHAPELELDAVAREDTKSRKARVVERHWEDVILALGSRDAVDPTATEVPPAAPPGGTPMTHTVTLRGTTPGATWELYPKGRGLGKGPALARCGEQGCTLTLPEGTYQLWVQGHSVVTTTRSLDVTSDLDLTVTAPSRAKRNAGRALFLTGVGALTLGGGAVWLGLALDVSCSFESTSALFSNYLEDGTEDSPSPRTCIGGHELVVFGLPTALLGAGVAPVGWFVYAGNRHLRIKPTGAPSPASAAPARVEVGLQLLGTGYGLGARVRF